MQSERIERLAEFLCSEFDFSLNPCVGYSWPEHKDDDGYRGDGSFVKLQPSDVQAYARENATRILAFLEREAVLSAAEPQPAPSVAVKALQMADETFRDLGWHDKYEATTAALAALSAQVRDVAGWKPIETAPKDGTPILGGHSEAVLTVWWEADGSQNNSGEPGWIDGSFNSIEENYTYPITHWMPLPAAPAKQEG